MNTGVEAAEKGAPQSSNGAPMVRMEGVRKSFGDNLVLDGIDLEVAHGDVLSSSARAGAARARSCAV